MSTFTYLHDEHGSQVLVNLAAISSVEFRTSGNTDDEAVQIRFSNGHVLDDVAEGMTAIYDLLVRRGLA